MTDKRYYAELITLFLDGEATHKEEQVLFTALAQDPLLHNEFKHAQQIHQALLAQNEIVPEELDKALFERLGIEPKTKRRPLAVLWRSLNYPGALRYAAILTVIIGGGVLLWKSFSTSMNMITTESQKLNSLTIHKVTPEPLREEFFSELPQQLTAISIDTTSRTISTALAKNSSKEQMESMLDIVERKNTFEKANSSVIVDTTSENIMQKQDDVALPEPIVRPTLTLTHNGFENSSSKPERKSEFVQDAAMPVYIIQHRYAIEARGIQNMTQATDNALPTISLAGMYQLSEQDWVGVTAGAQSFTSNTQSTQSTIQFTSDQNNPGGTPNVGMKSKDTAIDVRKVSVNVWYGAMYEKRFGNSEKILVPTARVTLGMFGVNPMGRLNTGILYSISNTLRASAGVEGTLFIDTNNTSWKSQSIVSGVVGILMEL